MIIQADVLRGNCTADFQTTKLLQCCSIDYSCFFFSVAQRYQVFRVPHIFMYTTKSC